jgi:hypothetical protein
VAGDSQVFLGLMLYLLVAATPTLLVWAAVRWLPAAFEWIMDAHARRRPQPRPCLESVVADLRRLRREVRGRPPTQTRRLAVLAAYDATLLQLCGIVGVDAPLADAPQEDRHLARLMTEAQLEQAGIALDPPDSARAA